MSVFFSFNDYARISGPEEGGDEGADAVGTRVPNSALKQEYRDNALGSRQALFIMG